MSSRPDPRVEIVNWFRVALLTLDHDVREAAGSDFRFSNLCCADARRHLPRFKTMTRSKPRPAVWRTPRSATPGRERYPAPIRWSREALQDRACATSRFENLGVVSTSAVRTVDVTPVGRREGLDAVLEFRRAVQSTTDGSGTSERWSHWDIRIRRYAGRVPTPRAQRPRRRSVVRSALSRGPRPLAWPSRTTRSRGEAQCQALNI